METKELLPFVTLIVFVGMLIGVGILILDNFAIAVKTPTDVVNETVTIALGTDTLAYDDVTTISYFGNATTDYTAYVAGDGINYTTAGVITVNSTVKAGDYQVSYTYSADSPSTTTTTSVVSAISPIAVTWMPLIVTVAILAIILTIVIGSFSQKR